MDQRVVTLPLIPRRVVHDVTEVDLASRIRAGLVTHEEIQQRFAASGFADWFERQGLQIWQRGVRSGG
jgi:hypothetical protein